MEISYNRLFKLLIDKGMKKTEFAKIAGLTPGTLAKLSKNQTVSMDSLIKMCKTLNLGVPFIFCLIIFNYSINSTICGVFLVKIHNSTPFSTSPSPP